MPNEPNPTTTQSERPGQEIALDVPGRPGGVGTSSGTQVTPPSTVERIVVPFTTQHLDELTHEMGDDDWSMPLSVLEACQLTPASVVERTKGKGAALPPPASAMKRVVT